MHDEPGAVAASEPIAAPEAPEVSPPEPVERSQSSRDSLDRALKQMSERGKPEPEPEAKPETEDRPRTPDGKFAPKGDAPPETSVQPPVAIEPPAPPAEPEEAPPARLRDDVKASWRDLPPNVRNDFTRVTKELEQGLTQYREQLDPFRPFLDKARETGTDPVAALRNYMGIEAELASNPLAGLDRICRNMGMDLRQIAAHVMGQPAPEPNAQVNALRQELAGYKQKADAYDTHMAAMKAKAERDAETAIAEFAGKPRFQELSGTIARLIKNGTADDLPEAYRMAELLNPLPAAQTGIPAAQTRAPAPQTSKAGLSLDGAPGGNAATVVRSKSNLEALQRASAKVGISL